MLNILAATTPIFLLIALGYAVVRLKWFEQGWLPALSAFVVRFALPALIFRSLSQRSPSEVLNIGYLAAYAAGSLAIMLLGMLWAARVRQQPLAAAALYGLGMACSNSAFVGYPIVHQLLGPVATLALALSMVVENLLLLPLGIALSDSGHNRQARFAAAFGQALLRLRHNPIILAIVLGMGCALLDWHLPSVLMRPIDMLANASAPCALFYIGGSLLGLPLRGMLRDIAIVSTGKLCLHPLLVAAGMLLWLPADPSLAMAGVLTAAMPMLSIYPILGQKHGLQGFCAATLLTATISAFFSISLCIWLLQASQLFGRM